MRHVTPSRWNADQPEGDWGTSSGQIRKSTETPQMIADEMLKRRQVFTLPPLRILPIRIG
jgi:hypothetical protein